MLILILVADGWHAFGDMGNVTLVGGMTSAISERYFDRKWLISLKEVSISSVIATNRFNFI